MGDDMKKRILIGWLAASVVFVALWSRRPMPPLPPYEEWHDPGYGLRQR